MSGGNYNITTEQGSTFTLQFDITINGTKMTSGLSGYSARMQVRSSASASTAVLDLVSPTNITLNTTTGLITVTVSAAQMAAVTAGKYVYDFELVSSGGIVSKPIKGKFIVLAEVTK